MALLAGAGIPVDNSDELLNGIGSISENISTKATFDSRRTFKITPHFPAPSSLLPPELGEGAPCLDLGHHHPLLAPHPQLLGVEGLPPTHMYILPSDTTNTKSWLAGTNSLSSESDVVRVTSPAKLL